MDDFVNQVNLSFKDADAIYLAAYVLWRLNNIHPFINGNGRTARAACYFVLCLKFGGWLKGDVILPELLKNRRADYVEALQKVDASQAAGARDLAPLQVLLVELLSQQLGISADASAVPEADAGSSPDPTDEPT